MKEGERKGEVCGPADPTITQRMEVQWAVMWAVM